MQQAVIPSASARGSWPHVPKSPVRATSYSPTAGESLTSCSRRFEASILRAGRADLEAGITMRAVFPGDCVLSVVTIMADGATPKQRVGR